MCGAAPSLRVDVEGAAALADALAAEWGPAAPEDSEAKRLALALHGSFPVITGAGLTAAIAYRWKCQINENAELPALPPSCPSTTTTRSSAGRAPNGAWSAVFLEDANGDPHAATRAAITAELAAEGAAAVERVQARGGTRLERLVSLVLLGDLVSLYLAVLRGVDPVYIRAIDALKARLGAAHA